jgi:hypothetical protein
MSASLVARTFSRRIAETSILRINSRFALQQQLGAVRFNTYFTPGKGMRKMAE